MIVGGDRAGKGQGDVRASVGHRPRLTPRSVRSVRGLWRPALLVIASLSAIYILLAATAAGRSRAGDPGVTVNCLDRDNAYYPLCVVIKYYEAIPTESTFSGQPHKLYASNRSGQTPSLYANRAAVYNDAGKGIYSAAKPASNPKRGTVRSAGG